MIPGGVPFELISVSSFTTFVSSCLLLVEIVTLVTDSVVSLLVLSPFLLLYTSCQYKYKREVRVMYSPDDDVWSVQAFMVSCGVSTRPLYAMRHVTTPPTEKSISH
jgi:hypothetical protein